MAEPKDNIIDADDYAAKKTDKLPEKNASEYASENLKLVQELSRAQIEESKARAELYKGLVKLVPLAEVFFKTKTPEVIEQFKLDLKRELDFSIAKVLFQAGLVDKELVDQMARQTYAPPPTQVRPSAADDALGNFDPAKLGTPRPMM